MVRGVEIADSSPLVTGRAECVTNRLMPLRTLDVLIKGEEWGHDRGQAGT